MTWTSIGCHLPPIFNPSTFTRIQSIILTIFWKECKWEVYYPICLLTINTFERYWVMSWTSFLLCCHDHILDHHLTNAPLDTLDFGRNFNCFKWLAWLRLWLASVWIPFVFVDLLACCLLWIPIIWLFVWVCVPN